MTTIEDMLPTVKIPASEECVEKAEANWDVVKNWLLKSDEKLMAAFESLNRKHPGMSDMALNDIPGAAFKVGFVAGWYERARRDESVD